MIRTVPAVDLQRTLDEMELSLDVSSEMCPYCRKVNVFPGFSHMLAYTCQHCGRAVKVIHTLFARNSVGSSRCRLTQRSVALLGIAAPPSRVLTEKLFRKPFHATRRHH